MMYRNAQDREATMAVPIFTQIAALSANDNVILYALDNQGLIWWRHCHEIGSDGDGKWRLLREGLGLP